MTIRLTPTAIIAAYEFLKATAPFNKWKLPDPDDLEFHVTSDPKLYGHFEVSTKKGENWPIIAISAAHTKSCYQLMIVMAHEMTHLKRFADDGTRGLNHGPKFKALARDICRVHCFDLKTF